ncbi:hypothetical protein ZIOFF_044613 [Zingiber officinale]|uniref:Gluconokinase n=1 Tax=Zingiber officinale TaxID=94328 RepID=A0A8J5FZE8_ZINOF|nr:hypothetical protein ZIOFF_044613 [Zingiber officinale]
MTSTLTAPSLEPPSFVVRPATKLGFHFPCASLSRRDEAPLPIEKVASPIDFIRYVLSCYDEAPFYILSGLAFVIMGVSGTGKSTVAEMLAKTLNCSFLEADDFHSKANKDEDRFPWLECLRDAIRIIMISGKSIVLTCSALQKKYREILRSSDPDYKAGQYSNCRVRFICLEAPVEVIADRIRSRSKEGKHFMPVSLLQSQLDLLQIDEVEGITKVDATTSLETIMDTLLQALSKHTGSPLQVATSTSLR